MRLNYGRDNQLGNSCATGNVKGLKAKVDQDYADLATIIRIYCTRRIQNCHAMFQGKAGSRPHLRFVTCWKFEANTCRDQRPPARLQGHRLICGNSGVEIGASRAGALIGRRRQAFAMREAKNGDSRRQCSMPAM